MHEYVKKGGQSDGLNAQGLAGQASLVQIRTLDVQAPRRWLSQGLADIRATAFRSLVYGLCFVLMGLGVDQAHVGNPAVALGLSGAFLFVGPFMSMGIYELSRQLQSGERVDLVLSMFSWCRNPAAVGRFAFFLSTVMVLWLWLSGLLLAALGQGIGLRFVLASFMWGMLALSVLMASAVAIPMLLDRPVSAVEAIRHSVRCFLANKAVLSLWFFIVAMAVSVSLALGYWPLLLLGPLLGHATWHAYQQCLQVSDIRQPGSRPSQGWDRSSSE